MKKLSLSLFLIILIGCSTTRPRDLPTAGPSHKLMEAATKILLIVNDSPKSTYTNFRKYLVSKNIALDNSNEKLLFFKTSLISSANHAYPYNFKIFIRKNENGKTIIQLSGNIHTPFGGMTKIFYIPGTGPKGKPVKRAWNAMLEIAKGYPHVDIKFARN